MPNTVRNEIKLFGSLIKEPELCNKSKKSTIYESYQRELKAFLSYPGGRIRVGGSQNMITSMSVDTEHRGVHNTSFLDITIVQISLSVSLLAPSSIVFDIPDQGTCGQF